ncbi:MAG: Flp pilus assembly complex ATPase component TadA [Betaproteobacteria bacterium]|nr:MAG: Flp pilus assembly complex ATPase component TadA [Betaproteobacteria bacterium]
MGKPEKIRLGEVLLQQGHLTQEQLETALREQKRSGRKLGRVLIDSGYLTEDQIAGALARQLDIPFIDLKRFNIKPELAAHLPETLARRFRAIVLAEDAAGYRIGFADPTDLFAYDEIARNLKKDVQQAVVSESALLQTIDRIYRRTEEISGFAQELGAELGDAIIDLGGIGASPSAEDAPVVKLLQSVFEDAVGVRASDIHIEPQEKLLKIRFRIDGVLHIQTQADSKIASALVLRLKLMSGLDISEKRLPQDGRFNVKVRNNQIDVRISTMPTQYGESVVMRLLNQSSGILKLDRIGLPGSLLERLRKVMARPSGMILVTGPTGSGKTTTLYSVLEELNTDARKIITVEDPVEYRLPGINQVQVHEKIDLSFSRVLRTALRQDPDIILVGEMRDGNTVETGLRAAMTGHLVLSTLHTNDSVSSPIRLLDMGAPAYMVAMSLQVVIAQRLVRIICDGCGEPYSPSAQEQAWLQHYGRSVADGELRKGTGCTRCNGTGYLGRSGVYEILEMTPSLVTTANQGDPAHFVAVASKQIEGETLTDHAIEKVFAGKTTIEEAMRISTQSDD